MPSDEKEGGSASESSSSHVLSSELFTTRARELKVIRQGSTPKSYFVQESVLASVPYFKAQLKRSTTRGSFELSLPADAHPSSLDHILMRLLSPQTPPWDCIRWCGAVKKDLPEALGIMVLSKKLLVDWIFEEMSGAIHLLASSQELAQLVRDVSLRAGLPELAPPGGDGGSLPVMSGEEVKSMLRSAANGHQAGRDFARDVVLSRHAQGHGSEDAESLLDVLKNADQIVKTWDDADSDFPIDVFAWLWDLISQTVLPKSENFKILVEAFSPLSSLSDRCRTRRRSSTRSTRHSGDSRAMDPDSCLQIKEAFKQLVFVGLRFHQIEAVPEDDLQAAFNIGFSCGSGSTNLLSFPSLHRDMPAFLPALVCEWLPTLGSSMGEWVFTKLHDTLKEKAWELLTPAVLAAFDKDLQMKCVLVAPTSFFDMAKLAALREGPCERARCRLATVAGELDLEILDFLRGKRPKTTRATAPCADVQTVKVKTEQA